MSVMEAFEELIFAIGSYEEDLKERYDRLSTHNRMGAAGENIQDDLDSLRRASALLESARMKLEDAHCD